MDEQSVKHFSEMMQNIFEQIRRDVIGQQEVVEGTIIAMIAGGNLQSVLKKLFQDNYLKFLFKHA